MHADRKKKVGSWSARYAGNLSRKADLSLRLKKALSSWRMEVLPNQLMCSNTVNGVQNQVDKMS